MSKHYHLETVVRHSPSQIAIDIHHRTAELIRVTTNCQFSSRVRNPLGKRAQNCLLVPTEKKITELVVVHCIGVGRVCNPHITDDIDISRIGKTYFPVNLEAVPTNV